MKGSTSGWKLRFPSARGGALQFVGQTWRLPARRPPVRAGAPRCCGRGLPGWRVKQLFSSTEFRILTVFYPLPSPAELRCSLFKRLLLTLACVRLLNVCSSLLLLQTDSSHACFMLLPGLCTVAASWKDRQHLYRAYHVHILGFDFGKG